MIEYPRTRPFLFSGSGGCHVRVATVEDMGSALTLRGGEEGAVIYTLMIMIIKCIEALLACLHCCKDDRSTRTNSDCHGIYGDVVGIVWMEVVPREEKRVS